MRHLPILLLLASMSTGGVAADAQALASDACRQAITALEREEAMAGARPRVAPDLAPGPIPRGLAQARRAAAAACLGPGAEISMPPQRQVEVPISADGIGADRNRAVPAASAPLASARPGAPAASPPLPRQAPPPLPRLPQVLSTCDAGGCWTSDGTRLQRVGPVLNGPRGACSVAGNAVTCP